MRLSRLLLVASAAMLAFGGVTHAVAFGRVMPGVEVAALPPFLSGSLKLLWLADSAVMLLLALVFFVAALKPRAVSPGVLALLALVPISNPRSAAIEQARTIIANS